MKSIVNTFRFIIFLVILTSIATAGADYYLMTIGNVPVFNRTYYDSKTKIQTYQGILYKASRKVLTSTNEPLEESSQLTYKLLVFDLSIPSTWKEKENPLPLTIKTENTCSYNSKLYYADLDKKIYTYCIDEITIKEKPLLDTLKTNSKIMDDVFINLAYQGLLKDEVTEIYQTRKDDEIVVYQCNNGISNDIYFTPKDNLPQDLCVYKDDDFKFIFTIEDKTPDISVEENNTENQEIAEEETQVVPPEIIYEDDKYIYQFDTPKSSYIFITTPEVRGKAATSTPLMTVLNQNILTIDELIEKGLAVKKVAKTT